MNAEHFRGITEYPKLTHGDVESPDLKDLSAYIRELTGCGVIIADEALEEYCRKVASLPERQENQEFDREMRAQRQKKSAKRRMLARKPRHPRRAKTSTWKKSLPKTRIRRLKRQRSGSRGGELE